MTVDTAPARIGPVRGVVIAVLVLVAVIITAQAVWTVPAVRQTVFEQCTRVQPLNSALHCSTKLMYELYTVPAR